LLILAERRILALEDWKQRCLGQLEERAMATGPNKRQEMKDDINVAAVNPRGDTQEARFIVPWRITNLGLLFGQAKEHDSCGSGEGGECGCGISPDEK